MLTRGEDLLLHPPVITMPLLVQQGSADKVTSVDATKEMFEKLPKGNEDRELKIWEGYFHELHNEPESLRNESIKYIADWIVKRCDAEVPKAKL
jgi:acylglycerol lipase